MTWLKRFLTPPLIVLAAIFMLIEETLWEWLKVVTAWVAKFPLIRWYEASLQRLPPYPTMVVFLVPGICLFPVKLGAVWLMTHGQVLIGFGVIIAAKVVGTAIVARSYVVCKPKLMTIGWFARLHDWLMTTRDFLYGRIQAMPLYHKVRAVLSRWKQSIRSVLISIRAWLTKARGRGMLMLRWRAIRRWMRRGDNDV